MGPVTQEQRIRAQACYKKLFASETVYGAMARYLERLAKRGNG